MGQGRLSLGSMTKEGLSREEEERGGEGKVWLDRIG